MTSDVNEISKKAINLEFFYKDIKFIDEQIVNETKFEEIPKSTDNDSVFKFVAHLKNVELEKEAERSTEKRVVN